MARKIVKIGPFKLTVLSPGDKRNFMPNGQHWTFTLVDGTREVAIMVKSDFDQKGERCPAGTIFDSLKPFLYEHIPNGFVDSGLSHVKASLEGLVVKHRYSQTREFAATTK